ncbi:MAG: alpha/beta hydrolase [Rubrivivax sp.]|nr:alpha/beta hydrolase [Rubrivivax sp.]
MKLRHLIATPLALALATVLLLAGTAALAADAPASAPFTTRTLPRADVIAKHADAASKFVDLDGVKVHYKDEGQGPAILLVHGTFGDLADWDGWVKVLKPAYRVVRLDLPAFGLTGPIASGVYSVERKHVVIDALMDHLGIERFAIAGVSYGGLVAFRYAATRTERVTALILANSAGIQFGQRPAAASAAAAAGSAPPAPVYNITTDPVVRYSDAESFLRFLLNNSPVITPALIERKLAFTNTAGRLEESVLAGRQYERGSPERVLAHVRAPSLVLWGGAGQALSTRTADAFFNALKNAPVKEKILYPEGGHIINLQRPEETARDAKAFLDRNVRP